MLRYLIYKKFKNPIIQQVFRDINSDVGLHEYIQSDAFRLIGTKAFDDNELITLFWRDATFRWLVNFRVNSIQNTVKQSNKVFLSCFDDYHSRIDIPIGTKIGYGLYIGHGGPIVVNETTKIGNNCNLSHFTTIGSNKGKAATIGDNVYIGPNVCIVEDVRIGNNVTIGAGSVVTKDIPDNATAVGNCAKVINYNEPSKYIGNRWEGIG